MILCSPHQQVVGVAQLLPGPFRACYTHGDRAGTSARGGGHKEQVGVTPAKHPSHGGGDHSVGHPKLIVCGRGGQNSCCLWQRRPHLGLGQSDPMRALWRISRQSCGQGISGDISPPAEPAPPQLTLTGSAPQSCHHHFPSATSPPGPGGAGRTFWSRGCLGRLTSAGTGSAGPSGAPPATGKAKLVSWNTWAALIFLHWKFDGGQEGFALHGQ